MSLLTISNNKLEISPYALSIKEFKSIWDRDTSKTKDRAVAELSYIYFMKDIKSTYLPYEESIRGERINKSLSMEVVEDEKIKNAMKTYNDLHKTMSMFILEDSYTAVNSLRAYLREVDLLEVDKNGKPKHSSTQLVANIKNISSIMRELKQLEEDMEKDIINGKARVRGGGIAGKREVPNRRQ
jgi:hypothetical protein